MAGYRAVFGKKAGAAYRKYFFSKQWDAVGRRLAGKADGDIGILAAHFMAALRGDDSDLGIRV